MIGPEHIPDAILHELWAMTLTPGDLGAGPLDRRDRCRHWRQTQAQTAGLPRSKLLPPSARLTSRIHFLGIRIIATNTPS